MKLLKPYLNEIKGRPYQAVMDLYLLLLGVGLSLYLYDGYYGISYDKFLFWQKHTLIFMGLLTGSIILTWVHSLNKPKKEAFIHFYKSLDLTDWCVLAYAVFCTVSFLFSIDREEALWGTFGWHTGWLSQIMMVFWYFPYKKLYRWHTGSFGSLALGAFLAMMIGVLQRFELITISEGAGAGFYLSTIGNINWYAGYLSVMVPLIIGLFLSCKRSVKWVNAFYCVILVITFLACITNGSNSLYLMLAGVFPVACILSIFSHQKFYKFTLVIAMFGFALEIIHLIILNGPPEWLFLGNHDNYGFTMAEGHRGLFLTAVSTEIGLLGCSLLKKYEPRFSKASVIRILKDLAYIGFALLTLFVFLQVTDQLGLRKSWGNHRGALWRVASFMYLKLPLYRKLIGVGPDCFSLYLTQDLPSFQLLEELYGAQRVTNAHSELLTMMINLGILGTLSFFLSLSSAVVLSLPFTESEDAYELRTAIIKILVITGVLMHFLVSFQHMMLMPYVFVLLGAGVLEKKEESQPVALERKKKRKKRKK